MSQRKDALREEDFQDTGPDSITDNLDDLRDISITLSRPYSDGDKLLTGDWCVDVLVDKQGMSTGPFNMPSLALRSAIAEIEKQFGIKISDKK